MLTQFADAYAALEEDELMHYSYISLAPKPWYGSSFDDIIFMIATPMLRQPGAIHTISTQASLIQRDEFSLKYSKNKCPTAHQGGQDITIFYFFMSSKYDWYLTIVPTMYLAIWHSFNLPWSLVAQERHLTLEILINRVQVMVSTDWCQTITRTNADLT